MVINVGSLRFLLVEEHKYLLFPDVSLMCQSLCVYSVLERCFYVHKRATVAQVVVALVIRRLVVRFPAACMSVSSIFSSRMVSIVKKSNVAVLSDKQRFLLLSKYFLFTNSFCLQFYWTNSQQMLSNGILQSDHVKTKVHYDFIYRDTIFNYV